MSTPTLSEILNVPSVKTIFDTILLPELRRARDGIRLPVTDWKVGGVYRTLSYGVSNVANQVWGIVAAFGAATFGDYVFGLVEAPGGLDVTSFATQHARDRYGVRRIEATRTKRSLTVTNALATARNITAGDMIVKCTATGNTYRNAEAYVSAGSDDVVVLFESEFPVDSAAGLTYLDVSDSSWQLVTSILPGVTVTNPASTYSDVTQVGPGLGTVTPSVAPTQGCNVTIRIDVAGLVGGGQLAWRMTLDDGTDSGWTTGVVIDTLDDLFGNNVHIEFANNGGGFLAGTFYYFSSPGTDVVSVGRDQETPQELGARCRAVLPLLSFAKDGLGNWIPTSPTMSGYEALARSASDQVKVCLVRTSATINNKVHVIVAGQGSPLAGSTIILLQAFFDAFQMLTDSVEVANAATQTITLANAMITCRQSAYAAALVEMQRRIANYFGGVDAAQPLAPGGTDSGLIERAYLISLIRTVPGVTNFTEQTFTINAATADFQLPNDSIPSWSQQVATAFTWSLI